MIEPPATQKHPITRSRGDQGVEDLVVGQAAVMDLQAGDKALDCPASADALSDDLVGSENA